MIFEMNAINEIDQFKVMLMCVNSKSCIKHFVCSVLLKVLSMLL